MLLAQEVEPAAGFPAFLIVVIAILVFHGSIYLLVGLNTGWRFGYWVAGAALGGLFMFLSLFWLSTPGLGPRGEEPRFYPIEASTGPITESALTNKRFGSPGAYPGAPWTAAEDEIDPFKASASNCTTFIEGSEAGDLKIEETEEQIGKLGGFTRNILEGRFGKKGRMERELEVCTKLSGFLPPSEAVPVVDGQPVTVTYDVEDVRFTRESGVLLGAARVVPNTYDKRVTNDPAGKRPLKVGDEIYILAYRDPGSLKYPSIVYVIGSFLFFGIHMWGLHRAERRKLSPLAV